jgi:hypothetical protein
MWVCCPAPQCEAGLAHTVVQGLAAQRAWPGLARPMSSWASPGCVATSCVASAHRARFDDMGARSAELSCFQQWESSGPQWARAPHEVLGLMVHRPSNVWLTNSHWTMIAAERERARLTDARGGVVLAVGGEVGRISRQTCMTGGRLGGRRDKKTRMEWCWWPSPSKGEKRRWHDNGSLEPTHGSWEVVRWPIDGDAAEIEKGSSGGGLPEGKRLASRVDKRHGASLM